MAQIPEALVNEINHAIGEALILSPGEETTVLRKDIAEIKAWPASLMPEGIENNVAAQDFADLLEFLSPSRP